MPTYRAILKKSIYFILTNKKLWFLGFFIALLGNGGEYEIVLNSIRNLSLREFNQHTIINLTTNSMMGKQILYSIQNLASGKYLFETIGFLTVLLLLMYLAITAEGTLIRSAYRNIVKKQKVNIKVDWVYTRKKFAYLLVAHVLLRCIGIIIAFLITLPFIIIFQAITGVSFLGSAILFGLIIFAPIMVIVSFLIKYTIIFIVIKNKSLANALQSSILLFKSHWLVTVENAAVLFIINLFIGLFTLILALIISFPIIAATSLSLYPLALDQGYYLTIVAWTSLLIAPVIGSMLATFQYAAWTAVFTKITLRRPITSKLTRVTQAALSRINL